MRLFSAAALALFLAAPASTACKAAPTDTELTRTECAQLVRHVQHLESADVGGLADALNAGLRSGIEGCLVKGTVKAHRCVMQAETLKDLESCNSLFNE